MIEKEGTIYFYKLDFSKFTGKFRENGEPLLNYVDADEFKKEFNKILINYLNEFNTLKFSDGPIEISLEIIDRGTNINSISHLKEFDISEELNWYFGKLGKSKDKSST